MIFGCMLSELNPFIDDLYFEEIFHFSKYELLYCSQIQVSIIDDLVNNF